MGLVHEIDYGTPESKSEKQVTLTIDGFEVTVPEGTSVMRASMEAGIQIPKLCATDMVDAFDGAQPGQLLILALEGRQLEGFEIMGKQDLRDFGVHAASSPCAQSSRIYAFADVVSTVALGE